MYEARLYDNDLGDDDGNFSAAPASPVALPPEIAFLRADVATVVLIRAARRARELGVTAEAVLIAEGLVPEDAYYRALARRIDCPFIARAAALAPGFDYRAALRAGLARADRAVETFDWLASPRGAEIAALIGLADSGAARQRVAICAPSLFSALARARGRRALAEDASFALARANPGLCANAPRMRLWSRAAVLLSVLALAALAFPQFAPQAVSLILSLLFLGGIHVRLCATVAALSQPGPPPPPLSDRALPSYTILAPMHREASVAAQFVAALKALDYPVAKLEIKFVVEENDRETVAALRAAGLAPNMEIVVAPNGAPQTKPRALNAALPLARGELLTIFDAEDRPERDQLRVAAEAFAAAGPRVACLQARLVIDNAAEHFLSHFFAIGYAALFDVINPGLAQLRLPIPLGGTSNHFRTEILRRVTGWDAWNVTEDADLGLRLARHGFEVGMIAPVTCEDAPVAFGAWLGQRTRWMKGWMQTLAVMLSAPGDQVRRMGAFPAFATFATIFSLLAGPLLGPFYGARMVHDMLAGDLLSPNGWAQGFQSGLACTVALSGAISFVAPALLGMKRRAIRPSWRLALTPLYLAALSLAGWRALWEWTRKPHVWNKTEHAPRPKTAQAASGFRNLPARASAISARVLSTP